jgi:hypothetical protein
MAKSMASGRARCQRNGDNFAPFAQNSQGAMTTLKAESLDVGAGRF